MNLNEFIKKWDGKYCEVTGSSQAINQCTDLANEYIREVLGLPIIEWTNAQDFPKKCLAPQYEYILNTPNGVPNPGNIIIWKSKNNIGHIAIFVNGSANKFNSFDQNFPLGSPCHIQSHTYTTASGLNVIGWLRCKQINNSEETMLNEEQKRILQFIEERNLNEGQIRQSGDWIKDDVVNKQTAQIATLSQKVLELDKFTKELEEKITILTSEVTSSNEIILKWQQEAKTAKEQASNATAQIQQANEEKNKYRRLYENLLDTTIDKLSLKDIIVELQKRLFKLLGKK
jgi:hypothetical protein